MFTWCWQKSHRSDALFGVSRLDATADSNHSCCMKCPFFWTMAVTEQTETEHLSETWYQKDNVVYLALVRIWPLIQQQLRDINDFRAIKDQIDILGSLKMLQETLKTMFLVIHLDIPNQSWILNIWLWRFWCSDGDSMIFDGLGTHIGWAIRWRLLCQYEYDMFGIVQDGLLLTNAKGCPLLLIPHLQSTTTQWSKGHYVSVKHLPWFFLCGTVALFLRLNQCH